MDHKEILRRNEVALWHAGVEKPLIMRLIRRAHEHAEALVKGTGKMKK
jgi:hypothetical protein